MVLAVLYYSGSDVFLLTANSELHTVRGSCSSWSHVRSGVPQGTILGPIFFLIYINDLPNEISSSVKLFADDTKVYRELVEVESDTLSLQSDLNRMSELTKACQLGFNPEKCEVMGVTHQRDSSVLVYYLSGNKLKVVNKFEDLEIVVTSDLSWSDQVNTAVNKANRVWGLIKVLINSI